MIRIICRGGHVICCGNFYECLVKLMESDVCHEVEAVRWDGIRDFRDFVVGYARLLMIAEEFRSRGGEGG